MIRLSHANISIKKTNLANKTVIPNVGILRGPLVIVIKQDAELKTNYELTTNHARVILRDREICKPTLKSTPDLTRFGTLPGS